VTTMFMDAGMDTGDIILQAPEPITEADTAGSLAERLAPIGARLLGETLDLLVKGTAPHRPQKAEEATYAPLLKREHGFIDWTQSAAAIRNRIHGCNPAPGAVALREGRPVKWCRARAEDAPAPENPGEPGVLLRIAAGGPIVAAGGGAVQLLELQPENRPRLSGDEYSRGYRVIPGERFTTPLDGQAVGSVP
jgi:methionyl-tRNA formyltransferase